MSEKLTNRYGSVLNIDAETVIVKIGGVEMTLAKAIADGKIGKDIQVVAVLDDSATSVPSCHAVTVALQGKQNKLTAGANITIDANGVISATGGGGGGSVTIDTTIPSTPANDHVPSTKLLSTELAKKQGKLTAGDNVTIDANGKISANLPSGTTQSATAVAYTNGQTTQSGGTVADKLTELDELGSQIYNTPIPHYDLTKPIKILCFGSSWFCNTWWYLNKILASAGISAEIHGYYMGHSQFSEWIDFYKGNLTPFEGSESGRSASYNESKNGADYTIKTYSANGAYNAQAYRDNWYNDITSGEYDVICFQQGAQQAVQPTAWSYGGELCSIIKRHCKSRTFIAFNSTWTPAKYNAFMQQYPHTEEGQRQYQAENYRNTKKLMRDIGLPIVAPNGALVWAMRHNTTLNVNSDEMSDGKGHLNHGLPMYAISANFYQTFFAEMFGVEIEDVEWLPSTTTQKCPVNQSSWQDISEGQLSEIRRIIHLSQSDRFSFRT